MRTAPITSVGLLPQRSMNCRQRQIALEGAFTRMAGKVITTLMTYWTDEIKSTEVTPAPCMT